jgi:hypothetical protein
MAVGEEIELSISTENVCFIIIKARQFEAKEDASAPDESSNPSDDRMVEVLENRRDDPVYDELLSFINGLGEDEQIDLVTLTWLGRGDAGVEEWDDLRAQAEEAHNKRTAQYLLGQPLLPDYLEEGLSMLGRSCEDEEAERL